MSLNNTQLGIKSADNDLVTRQFIIYIDWDFMDQFDTVVINFEGRKHVKKYGIYGNNLLMYHKPVAMLLQQIYSVASVIKSPQLRFDIYRFFRYAAR